MSVLLAVFGAAACTVSPPAPGPERRPEIVPEKLDLVPQALRIIEAGYVDTPDFSDLTPEAVRALERFTPQGSFRIDAAGDAAGLLYRLPGETPGRLRLSRSPYREAAVRDLESACAVARRLAPAAPKAELEQAMLRGLLRRLDPRSGWIDPVTYRAMQAEADGRLSLAAVGVTLKLQDDTPSVVGVIEGGPAARAGIQAGDRVLRIDGLPTEDMGLPMAVEKLRGEAGTSVTIAVAREGFQAPRDFRLVREAIVVESVVSEVVEPGTGLVRVRNFQENTGASLRTALDDLSRAGGVQAFIVDLRNNSGGLLSAAAEIAEQFLPPGKLVLETRGRSRSQNMRFLAHAVPAESGMRYTELPVVVLVNAGTAGSAEIVAAALQDHERAVVVGEPSAGLGEVQTIIPLSDGSALRLTTARYFRPDGRLMYGNGVEPDVPVAALPGSRSASAGPGSDPQLRQALDVLKALRAKRGTP